MHMAFGRIYHTMAQDTRSGQAERHSISKKKKYKTCIVDHFCRSAKKLNQMIDPLALANKILILIFGRRRIYRHAKIYMI